MGKSINPISLLFKAQGDAIAGSAPGLIVLMSLQPAIPWRVALLHCPPPLHRLDFIYHPPTESVNHHLARPGEFSTGTMGNFQPVLTTERTACNVRIAEPGGTEAAHRELAHAVVCHAGGE
jgi:hypothetical protein